MTSIREIAEKYTTDGRDRCDIDVLTLALREFGEELAILCEDNPRQTASVCAEKIRAAIRESL